MAVFLFMVRLITVLLFFPMTTFCNNLLVEAILHWKHQAAVIRHVFNQMSSPGIFRLTHGHVFLTAILQEGLTVSKNMKVQQSYEELEAAFEPGKEFCFDATVHLQ
jgi:hypothetical protein